MRIACFQVLSPLYGVQDGKSYPHEARDESVSFVLLCAFSLCNVHARMPHGWMPPRTRLQNKLLAAALQTDSTKHPQVPNNNPAPQSISARANGAAEPRSVH